MIELVGENDEGTSFRQVSWRTYLAVRGDDRRRGARGTAWRSWWPPARSWTESSPPDASEGSPPRASSGKPGDDESAKAVVLRIDSPGGSVFASELIHRECTLVREEGKPLVVSMGSLAASAAYFISSTADEIWARPSTITGSIGIFALFPTFQKAPGAAPGNPLRRRGHHQLHRGTEPRPGPGPPLRRRPSSSASTTPTASSWAGSPRPGARPGTRWTGSPAAGSGAGRTPSSWAWWTSWEASRTAVRLRGQAGRARGRVPGLLRRGAADLAGAAAGATGGRRGRRPGGGKPRPHRAGRPGPGLDRERAGAPGPLERPERPLRPLPLRRGVALGRDPTRSWRCGSCG